MTGRLYGRPVIDLLLLASPALKATPASRRPARGPVLFAKLYNDTQRLDALRANWLALLGVRGPGEPAVLS
jgi:hypothetical protein